MSGPSDHAARAPSARDAAKGCVARHLRNMANRAGDPWDLFLTDEIAKEIRSARKQALEDAARVAENRIRREAERTHVAAAIRALAQEEAP